MNAPRRSPAGPLRKVVSIREGKVRRRARDGSSREGDGLAEILECGHEFVPYDNHRLGGQDEIKSIGAKRRCDLCPIRPKLSKPQAAALAFLARGPCETAGPWGGLYYPAVRVLTSDAIAPSTAEWLCESGFAAVETVHNGRVTPERRDAATGRVTPPTPQIKCFRLTITDEGRRAIA